MEFLNWLLEFSHTNPLVGPALSIGVVGYVGWASRSIMRAIIERLDYLVRWDIHIDNGRDAYSTEKLLPTFEFLNRIGVIHKTKQVRIHGINEQTGTERWEKQDTKYDNTSSKVVLGYGNHFFWYKGHLFMAAYTRDVKTGSADVDHIHIVTMLCRRSVINQLIYEITPRKKEGLALHKAHKDEWGRVSDLPAFRHENLILKGDQKEQIFAVIDNFINDRNWYIQQSIPYKLTILLYGPPGTGKTRLIEAIANKFGFSIGIIPAASLTPDYFGELLASVPDRTIAVVEEFDKVYGIRDTTARKSSVGDGDVLDMVLQPHEILAGYLQVLDGLIRLDGQIVILTTNHIDKIDPAAIRPERIDYAIEVGPLDADALGRYTEMRYGEHHMFPEGLNPVTGARAQQLYRQNRYSRDRFIDAIEAEMRKESGKHG